MYGEIWKLLWKTICQNFSKNTCQLQVGSAIIYSIIETPKLNGLNPFNYLTYLFEELPNTRLKNESSLEHLLLWSDQLAEECHGNLNSKTE
ncbi:transposase domain-containing protein [Alkaliphilus metalliredigens]|uniref:transposase domain-containing protein n=1 Tax=Alkaliphilus metalliredigens TaxID=208226 RepID=UPI000A01C595